MTRRALLALALTSALVQASEPPVRNWVVQVPERALAGPPVFYTMLGSMKVEFQKTTLQQVITAAAAGRIEHAGDAAGSTYWVCYVLREGAAHSTVWLLSGEMGGLDHEVLEVLVTNASTGKDASDCPVLPAHMREVSLSGGLTLGMPSDRMSAQLDVVVGPVEKWYGYRYSIKIPSQHCGGEVDGGGAIAAQVKDGKVVALAATQGTSC